MVNGSDKLWLLLGNSGLWLVAACWLVEIYNNIDLDYFSPKETLFQYMERRSLYHISVATVIQISVWSIASKYLRRIKDGSNLFSSIYTGSSNVQPTPIRLLKDIWLSAFQKHPNRCHFV